MGVLIKNEFLQVEAGMVYGISSAVVASSHHYRRSRSSFQRQHKIAC